MENGEQRENWIPTHGPKIDFKDHLTREENKRIIFSGKFGIGKTFFLEKFFDEHEKEYDVYHLFPIKYQIASNENILDFLKYDILVELLKEHPEAFNYGNKQDDKNLMLKFQKFFQKKCSDGTALKSAIDIFSIIPIVGKLGKSLDELQKLYQEFQNFSEEVSEDDEKKIETFLKEQEGKLLDSDYMSAVLNKKIEELKKRKKSVLILDDFERIDPEHIFRILNHLSVHMERNDPNMLGFDHVIIVCDVNNIKSIFHHKYGDGTDFKGYFDKFFTKKIFHFDNEKAIIEYIPTLIRNIKCNSHSWRAHFQPNSFGYHFLKEVFVKAFRLGKLNLRQLYRPIKYFNDLESGIDPNLPYDYMYKWLRVSNGLIHILIAIFDTEEDVLEILKLIYVKLEESGGIYTTEDEIGDSTRTGAISSMFYTLNNHRLPNQGDFLFWSADFNQSAKFNLESFNEESADTFVRLSDKSDNKSMIQFFYAVLIKYIETGKYKERA